MSTNLYWKPVVPATKTLPCALKFVLRKSLGWPVRLTANHESVQYFAGLRAAGVEGAQEVLDLLREHDEIELFEE